MNKKRLFTTSITLVTIGLIAGATWYIINQKNLELPTNKKENVEEKEILIPFPDKFIILPDNYSPTKEDLDFINSLPEKTVILIDGKEIPSFNTSLEKKTIGNRYTKCNKQTLADETDSAAIKVDRWTLHRGECDNNDTQNVKVIEISSNSLDESLILELKKYIGEENTYIYISNDPLLSIYTQSTPTIEQKYNQGYIISWDSLLQGTLEQQAYSIEIIEKDKRVYASGKKEMYNSGDYFFPIYPLETGIEYELVLRLWIGLDKLHLENPVTIRQDFKHTTFENSTSSPKSAKAPVEMSWIPDWGLSAGLDSVKKSPKKWHTISPVWFWPNKDGSLKKERHYNDSSLIYTLKQNKIKLVPTITLFDADILTEVLNKHMDTHIKAIVDVVNKGSYDGIDLDYESTYKDDQELLFEFLEKLKTELGKNNKTLSFTVVPKIDDREIYSFLPQTHYVQEWDKIGEIVDEFRIMAYDFTGQSSLRAGPLSPIAWDEALIQYAIEKMPAEKIVLALPLYSHAWVKPKTSNLVGTNNDKSLSSGTLKNTYSWQHDDIAYIKRHSAYYKEKREPWTKEVRVEMMYKGTERIMYYLDKKAVQERLDLAKEYGIKGICYWRIGGEDL